MSIVLTWDAYPNATLYGVYRTTDLSIPYTLLTTVVVPAYTDTSAVATSVYWYYIIAFNGATALTGSNPVLIGAVQNRVAKICSRISSRLQDKAAQKTAPDQMIDLMTRVQLELCRKYLAYKTEFALSMIANQINYPAMANIFKLKSFILPTSWRCNFKHTGLEIVSDARVWAHEMNALFYNQSHPQKAYVWNGILRLIPAPTVTGDILVCWAYALPTLDLVYLGDPEIGQEWDDCLENEVYFRITGDQSAHAKYLDDASTIAMQNYKETIAGDNLIEYSARELGF